MKKVLTLLMVFALILIGSIGVYASDKETYDVLVKFQKELDSDISLQYKDAISVISVFNNGTDITAEITSSIVQNPNEGDSLVVTIPSSYIKALKDGNYFINVRYRDSIGAKEEIVKIIVASDETPKVSPLTATYSGSDLEFTYSIGTGELVTNIIKSIKYNGINLSSSDYTYSSANETITIKDSFLKTKNGTISVIITFDNYLNTTQTITINCDYVPKEDLVEADIVTKFHFGINKTTDTDYLKEYTFVQKDKSGFPLSEFEALYSTSFLNITESAQVVLDKNTSGNAVIKVTSNNAVKLTDFSFDVSFIQKSTAEIDKKTISGKIMVDPKTVPIIEKSYDDYSSDNKETFTNQIGRFKFNIDNGLFTINYYGILNGKYDFNFNIAPDTSFVQNHGTAIVTGFNNIVFPSKQSFGGEITLEMKNIYNYDNPLIYILYSDGTLSELDFTYSKTTKLFSFKRNSLDYGYLISDGPIHMDEVDKEVSPEYGKPSQGGTNPGGTNPGGSNPVDPNPGETNPGGTNPGGSNPGGSTPENPNPGGSKPGDSNPGNDNEDRHPVDRNPDKDDKNPNNNPETGLLNLAPFIMALSFIVFLFYLIIKKKF